MLPEIGDPAVCLDAECDSLGTVTDVDYLPSDPGPFTVCYTITCNNRHKLDGCYYV